MQRTFDSIAEQFPDGAKPSTRNSQITNFVDILQDLDGGPTGYRLRRIILTNFWLYGQQEFEIPHGRLFLAGENASGKSTVLTAALPLALDGDLRPNRLDTFGGRERRIEYYVLGGADSATPFNHERRTAYIALEFEWCDPDHPPIAPEISQRWENGEREKTRFLTIGVSIAGNVNTTERIRPLRFLITDGSRLGYEFDTLYETGSKHEKRAYDHQRFKQILEGHGIVCDSQADYERQVARYLFGYQEVKDFGALINLLLVLRRPNLSTELNFSRVHDYLKMSLRKIPAETTAHVIGTIERIDGIQHEIEQIQEAYDAAQRLHLARQQLALAQSQLAACDYLGARLAENTVEARSTRQRRDLTAAERDQTNIEARIEVLQTEAYQVDGQIAALQVNEGLQIATQLSAVRERLHEVETQLQLQEQSLNSARQAVQASTESLNRQYQRFGEVQSASVTQLRGLVTIARTEAVWEMAAFQLEEALSQIAALTVDAGAFPEVPLAFFTLLSEPAQERVKLLKQIESLHQQCEKLDAQIQYMRNLEAARFQELDEARQQFQSAQDRTDDALYMLAQTLEPLATRAGLSSMLDDAQFALDDSGGEPSPSMIVDQVAAALQSYRQLIEQLEQSFVKQAKQAQDALHDLQMSVGGKGQEIRDVSALYEQKLAEPEYAPARTERRIAARAQLSAQGIASLPLYELLDFSPDLEAEQAGRIEQMLTDAGLLDALVVPARQCEQADLILAQTDLSDCRLQLRSFASDVATSTSNSLLRHLRFDEALRERQDTLADFAIWQETARDVLTVLARFSDDEAFPYQMQEQGLWSHGLLTGHAGSGQAHYIGKATRLRAREEALQVLSEQKARLEQEFAELTTRLAHHEHLLADLREQQMNVRLVLPQSGLADSFVSLSQSRTVLEKNRDRYQKSHQQTQELRQQYNLQRGQLERLVEGHDGLVRGGEQIQQTLLAMVQLQNQARTLQSQFVQLQQTWEECGQIRAVATRSQENEQHVADLYDRIKKQAVQIRAELTELQHVAASSNVEELTTRLSQLRERNGVLARELETERLTHARLDERIQNLRTLLTETEAQLQLVQHERLRRQHDFSTLLAAYPVEQLQEAYLAAQDEDYLRAGQLLLGEMTRESDIAARRESLEHVYREAYNALVRTFNHEQPFLLEYGPDLDDQGQISFLNENRGRPVELLELLGERIEIHRTLLGAEERQLFEDFLLQEIAEAIRTQILEAEEWVQEINHVLSRLPMIGEHYSLQWKPPAEYDMTKLGSHLAQHYRLLRKPAQALTSEETETLMSAFRREIEAVRLRQQDSPDMNFIEALEQVFDYREWFHFDVWVTQVGGQRQRLTDRIAGTRSGAEQLFALYVPLFAALGALYRNAAHGAPRLLALDEAFDKVSAANTQRIMEFLISQDFQWIMTGPQVSGSGSKMAASGRYLMIHEKGSPVATASASFWSDQQKVTSMLNPGGK
ncbi:TIGR02680 family protein [Dictyobacter vulcani]|uniref:Nuclease SbcCD subunit C n=1 Tax=Dictyobacter vulcani TaxID=2607529 RepID=A0A5J4KFR4_9CHLR|nr:SbcC/MukB-like Walker B domain-containing protein [Dictyobacter vulcani]GER86493.1 TIGR02680 family protein [Dictyobacter vulcani]